ncbi:carboxypeptidase regulatory-like domain-containing protein, partial [Myxococcota bacterium]|nr:carboxypeptidase regulatory-like domain-containing protein [Myxococcota bacterium]
MIRIVTPLTRLSTLPKLPALLLSLFLGLALVASCGGDDLSHFGDGDDTGTDDLIKGTIKGAICAVEDGIGSGEGYWLVGARVYVVYDSQVYQTLTEQSGIFTLEGVPVGDHELQVEKGSFTASTPVTVRA